MADELLRLYAERRRRQRRRPPPRRRRLPRLRGDLPVRRDARSGARDRRRRRGSRDAARRWIASSAATSASARPRSRSAPPSASRSAGKQVAVLCPTTVLAQQHFLTFEARMRELPDQGRVDVSLPDQGGAGRGRPRPEGRHGRRRHRHAPPALEGRALQAPRPPRRRRRAALRRHAQGAHQAAQDATSTCSRSRATPIPRTLQMAVTGLRDMSIITTPPVDRRAIRTVVTRHDENVHQGGDRPRARPRRAGLLRLQPRRGPLRARRAPRRARARARASASATARWARARSSRRCSTSSRAATTSSARRRSSRAASTSRAPTRSSSIAPTCSASSQLYQLRGRVGRAKERAYCYLIVPPPNAMTDEARARIEALERHTELGCGLPDRVARPRAPRRGRSPRRRAERHRRGGRLRALLPDARRGGARAPRRADRPRGRSRARRSTSTRSCPRTTWPTSACGSRSTSASRARDERRGRRRISRARWRIASARRRPRRAASST